MTLIYETQTFKRSIPTGLEGEVNDFINQAKNQKPEDLKRLLDRHGPYLKKRLGKFRIIAKLKYIDEIPTLILINIYARGDNRYEEFNANPEGFGELHLEPIINGELNKIYEFVKENKPIIPPKKPLPDYFYRWLSSSSLTYSEEEILIYETIDWCEKIKSPNFSKYQIRFYDILFKLVNQPEELNTIVYNNALKISFIQERSDYKILYAEFSTVNIPKVILLILPLTDPGQLPKGSLSRLIRMWLTYIQIFYLQINNFPLTISLKSLTVFIHGISWLTNNYGLILKTIPRRSDPFGTG